MNDIAYNPTLAVRQPPQPSYPDFKLLATTFADGDTLPLAHVAGAAMERDGGNQSPALRWTGAPAETQSFALTVFDPDAPTGSGFWHWAVYNLPADCVELAQNAGADIANGTASGLPGGAVQLKNDAGLLGYIGAAPPIGDKAHHYIFTIYALNTILDLPDGASNAFLGFNLNGKVLAAASLTAVFRA